MLKAKSHAPHVDLKLLEENLNEVTSKLADDNQTFKLDKDLDPNAEQGSNLIGGLIQFNEDHF